MERRIRALEEAFALEPWGDTGERERLGREFSVRALDAMASIKRAPIDHEPYRYSVERLRTESPITVAAHVAALAALEHEDEEEGREILAALERERGLDPARHEKLLEMFADIVRMADQSRGDAV